MTDRLFIDQDGDACLEPADRDDNLVALPARDDDGNILNPKAWERMVSLFNDAIPRAEADAMVAAAYEAARNAAICAKSDYAAPTARIDIANAIDKLAAAAIRAQQETSE